MHPRLAARLFVFGLATTLALLLAAAPVGAQGLTRLVSRSPAGAPANDEAYEPSLSADGRYVSFHAAASNLVPGDTDFNIDVFVYDTLTGVIRLASVGPGGTPDDGGGEWSSISGDGRLVAFQGGAPEWTPSLPMPSNAIWVYDLLTAQVSCVSFSPIGEHANDECGNAAMDGDGRSVAFTSLATNLVAGDTNDKFDVFVHDRITGTTVCASLTPLGTHGNDDSSSPTLSDDGRFVIFKSAATDLVAGDANGKTDVFVRDLVLGVTTRVSVSSTGIEGDDDSGLVIYGPTVTSSLSADGRYAAFCSSATNLVAGDTNQVQDIFVHDRLLGTTTRVSVGPGGQQADGESIDPRLTADGGQVVFSTFAQNILPGVTTSTSTVMVHTRATGALALASVSTSGAAPDSDCWEPAVSADGRHVAFHGFATNLVPGATGNHLSIFVRDRTGCSPTIASFCTGGVSSSGCQAALSASGTPSASAGTGFTLSVQQVEGQTVGLVFYGIAGPEQLPFGGGSSTWCVRQPFQRTGVRPTGGTHGQCNGQFAVDWNRFKAVHPSSVGMPFLGGETVWAQAWYRDLTAPGGSNLSNAIWFNVCP